MGAAAVAAVGIGAAFGAWMRWALGTWLNPLVPDLPLGTLVANVGGGLLVGVAVAFFASNSHLAPEWRLACITGFLGALTTFSTFSAESMQLLQAEKYLAAAMHSAAHLAGAILATVVGFAAHRLLA
jgi:fluoride exporter